VDTAARAEEEPTLRSPVGAGPCSVRKFRRCSRRAAKNASRVEGGQERRPRARVGGAKLQRVQGRVRDLLVGIGQRDPASGLSCSQLVLEDVGILFLLPWVADPLAPEEHRKLFHPRVGLFTCRAGQPPEAVEVLISPSCSV
jgi:hypothetical protein